MTLGRSAADANIIIGGLLFLWGLLTGLYLLVFHVQPSGCTVSSVQYGGVCYATWYYALIATVIGLLMMATGTSRRPIASEAEDLLRTDPFTVMVLAFFATTTAASAILLAVYGLGEWFSGQEAGRIALQSGSFDRLGLYASLTVAFGTVFIATFSINAAHVRRRRRFMRSFSRAMARAIGRD